jgi:hypothetical protein
MGHTFLKSVKISKNQNFQKPNFPIFLLLDKLQKTHTLQLMPTHDGHDHCRKFLNSLPKPKNRVPGNSTRKATYFPRGNVVSFWLMAALLDF